MSEPENVKEELPMTPAEVREGNDTGPGPDPQPPIQQRDPAIVATVNEAAIVAGRAINIIQYTESMLGPQLAQYAPALLQKAIDIYPMLEFHRRDTRKQERKAARNERRQQKKERQQAAQNAADLIRKPGAEPATGVDRAVRQVVDESTRPEIKPE